MDTWQAFAMGEANRNNPEKVFDWIKAAELIKEKNPQYVRAGLGRDWGWTGGTIYQDGKPVFDSYTFLASTWAIPEIDIDGEIEECWVWLDDSPGWDSDTKWPQEALNILEQ